MKHSLLLSIIATTSLSLFSIENAHAKSHKYICSNDILKTGLKKDKSSAQINFANWADYMSPKIIPCFSKLTDSRVKYTYTSDDNMTKAKVMTGASGFDIVEQGSLYMQSEIASDALLELDKSKLPNLKYKNDFIYKKVAEKDDPDNKYGVIYSYGTTGIAYNKGEIAKHLENDVIPNSWDYIYNPEKLKKLSNCGISLLDESEQIFGNYFYYKGIDPNTTSKAAYEEAALYLIKNVRPYIKYFDSNKYQNDFTAGNLCLVMGFSGDVVRSVERAKDINPDQKLAYVLPKEGTNIWFDMLIIPKSAKNLDAVYELINYVIDPYISAKNSNYLYQPNAMVGNEKYLNKLFDNPNVKPTNEELEKMYVINLHDDPELQSFINRMWMNVKYGITFEPKYYKPTK